MIFYFFHKFLTILQKLQTSKVDFTPIMSNQKGKSDIKLLLESIKGFVDSKKCNKSCAVKILKNIFTKSFLEYCTTIKDSAYVVFINESSRDIKTWIDENRSHVDTASSLHPFQYLGSSGLQVMKHIAGKEAYKKSAEQTIANAKSSLRDTLLRTAISCPKFMKDVLGIDPNRNKSKRTEVISSSEHGAHVSFVIVDKTLLCMKYIKLYGQV